MAREQRRELMLAAATAMVAERGFAGVSTDAVAQAAGVSQPYVVQMFGSKAQLLAAVFERTSERVLAAFAAVPAGPRAEGAMSAAYMSLAQDGDLLRVLVHGLCAGTDPVIGPLARFVLTETVRLFQERTGSDLQTARDFLAHGMLINVLLVAAAPAHLHESALLEQLSRVTMGPALIDSWDAATPRA